MFSYNMENRGSTSLYEYLYKCIRHDIAHGIISPNQKLPSKRTAAKHLGVSLITVEAAYQQLIAEGYVRTRERSGYYVCELAPALQGIDERPTRAEDDPAPSAPLPTARETTTGDSAAQRKCALPQEPQEPTLQRPTPSPSAMSARQITMATRLFPYSAWAKCMRQTLSEESSETLAQAASAAGSRQLREAIAAYLHDYRGMNVNAGQIIIGAGSQTLYQLIIQLLGRNRTYAVENPGYPLLTSMYQMNNASLAHVGMDESGIIVNGLRSTGASVAHVMPSHQFPTGIITTASRRRELLNWAREDHQPKTLAPPKARYIIEDDYDSEFRMTGKPISPLYSIDAASRVLYLNSFAKSLGKAFRIAYLVLPPMLADRFHAELGFYSNTVSPIDQLTLARFIEDGHYERHVNRLRTQARQVQNIIVDELSSSLLKNALSFQGLNSGLHFLLTFNDGRNEETLVKTASQAGVSLTPMSRFQHRGKTQGETPCFVLRTDAVTPDKAKEYAQRIIAAFRSNQA